MLNLYLGKIIEVLYTCMGDKNDVTLLSEKIRYNIHGGIE